MLLQDMSRHDQTYLGKWHMFLPSDVTLSLKSTPCWHVCNVYVLPLPFGHVISCGLQVWFHIPLRLRAFQGKVYWATRGALTNESAISWCIPVVA